MNIYTNIIKEKYKYPVLIPCKIDMVEVKIETLLKDLPVIIEELRKGNYHLLGSNLTQDLAEIFNKKEICKINLILVWKENKM